MTSTFNGVECFTDSSYVIKLSNPDKFMLVSKNSHPDSMELTLLFSKGLSSFTKFEKKAIGRGRFIWDLSGGTEGITSMKIVIDIENFHILSLLSELAPDHPLLMQFNSKKLGLFHKMFVRTNYDYSKELIKLQSQFSDYIQVKNDAVVPSEKYKDYEIQFIK